MTVLPLSWGFPKRTLATITLPLLAVLFSCAVVLPHFLQRTDTLYPFQGIEIMATDAETHYAARYHEILDGHWKLGNTYLSAPKDQLSILPPLPEWSLAMMSSVLPLDPVFSFVVLKGLCAFLVFCSAFLAAMAMTGRRYESLAAVTVMLFAAAAFSAPWDLRDILSSGSFEVFGWLRFARPVNPLWTMTWFFLTVFFLSRWVRKADIVWIVLAALTTSILLYSYFYAWTYLLAVVVLLFFWYAWQRDTRRLSHLLLYFLIFLLMGSKYFLHLSELTQHPWYLDTSRRLGLVPSRSPVIGAWIFALILLSFFGRRIAWKEQSPLVMSLAFGGLLAINQQVITGQHLFPHHYHWYFVQPLGTLCMTLVFLLVCRKYAHVALYRSVLVSVIVLSVVFGYMQQRDTYRTYRAEWGNKQVFAPLLEFVRENLPADSVMYSLDASLLDLLPVYTSMNVYTFAQAMNYLVPSARVHNSLFFTLWLGGLTPNDARVQFFTTLRSSVGSAIYAGYYRELRGGYGAMPDEVVARHVQDYAQYYALSFKQKMSLYPLDYFIVAPTDIRTEEYQMLLAGGTDVFSENGYRIVRLKQ